MVQAVLLLLESGQEIIFHKWGEKLLQFALDLDKGVKVVASELHFYLGVEIEVCRLLSLVNKMGAEVMPCCCYWWGEVGDGVPCCRLFLLNVFPQTRQNFTVELLIDSLALSNEFSMQKSTFPGVTHGFYESVGQVILLSLFHKLWNLCFCDHTYMVGCDFVMDRKLEQRVIPWWDNELYTMFWVSQTLQKTKNIPRRWWAKWKACHEHDPRNVEKIHQLEREDCWRTINDILKCLRKDVQQKQQDQWSMKNWILHNNKAPCHWVLLTCELLDKNNMVSHTSFVMRQEPNTEIQPTLQASCCYYYHLHI